MPDITSGFTEITNLFSGDAVTPLVKSIDVSNYNSFTLWLIGNNHVGQVSWQVSGDNFVNTNIGTYAYQVNVPSSYFQNATNVGNAVQCFRGSLTGRYFRVFPTAYTSGSLTGILHLGALPFNPETENSIQTGPWSQSLIPITAGGLKDFHYISAAGADVQLVKNSPGQVYGYELSNNSATAVAYVKLYNSATIPTAGAGTPFRTIGIAANSSKNLSIPSGLAFSAGIGFSVVGGLADNDATAVLLSQIGVDIDYF